MRKIFFLILFSCLSLTCFAQTDSSSIDSEVSRTDKTAQDKINEREKQLSERQGFNISSDNDSVPEFGQNNFGSFKNLDSSMTRSFGYFFDGNNGKMWNGKDTVSGQSMQDFQEKLNRMAPDFQNFFSNASPFGGRGNFGDIDSMMQRSFGFLFDGNKMMPFGNDSTQMNPLNKFFGNMDLGKLMEGDLFKNFGDFNLDKMPLVAPDDKTNSKKNLKKKDKYSTESL